MEIKVTLNQLEELLNEQKLLVIRKLSSHTYAYNKESTDGNLKDLPIDKDKLYEIGLSAKYPDDFEVLNRYLK